MKNLDWFHQLNNPPLTPPDWIFTPIWILIYISIAISFILYIKDGKLKNKKRGIYFFTIQMILNLLWNQAFFNMQNIKLALIIILTLFLSIILTINIFYKYSKISAYILIPYLLWVSFATYLNVGYFILN